ncbi:MAG: sulfatase-like hydrolase/transferase, partial [Rikenellaceae bacterium]
NWNGQITPGLDSIGFDYSFIMAATGDRVPCVYIEQGRVANLDPSDPIEVSYSAPFEGEPLGSTNPELLRLHPSQGHNQAIVDSISRIGYMRGGEAALWKDELIADRITERALNFITENAEDPFFLYFATNDIHVPRVPHWRFKGKSGMGDRGDAILEFDHSVGQILDVLDSLGIADNTLIILSSDNGPVLDDGYRDGAVELLGSHQPSAGLRGGKYSVFEGGTRVPFITNWSGKIPSGKVSDAPISQVDLFASLSQLIGGSVHDGEAADSQNQLKALMGQSKKGREVIVQDGYSRSIVVDGWKYIKPSKSNMKIAWNTGIETACLDQPQLFNLKKDPYETQDLAASEPKRVAEMAKILQEIEESGK